VAAEEQPRTLLEQLIRQDRRSYEELAEEFDVRAYKAGIPATMSAKHLRRLARRQRPHSSCRAGTRKVLESMFGRDFEDLFGPPDEMESGLLRVDLTSSRTASVAESAKTLTKLTKLNLERPTEATKLQVVPAVWSDLAVGWLVDPEGGEEPTPANSGEITTADVEVVRTATKMFAELDYQYGGGRARMLVAQCLASDALPRLQHASPTTELGRNYFSEVAALTRLAAWSAYDSGQHGLAQSYFALALRFARAAGDRALGGRILAGMSHQANYLGQYQRAVDLARAAHQGARGHATPTAMAMFHAMEARGLASLGREAECTNALLTAEAWLARSNPQEDPEWIHYFDAAELAAEHAHCFRDLGRPELSVEHAEMSLANAGDVYVRSKGFVTTVVATSHLQRGDVEHALAVAQDVVEAASQLQSRRILSYLQEFRQQLLPHRKDPRVQQFEDYLRSHVRDLEGPPISNGFSVA